MSKQFFRKMIEVFPNSEIEYNNIIEEDGELLETLASSCFYLRHIGYTFFKRLFSGEVTFN